MSKLSLLYKWIIACLSIVGLISLVVGVIGLVTLMKHYQLTPRQVIVKATEKSCLNTFKIPTSVSSTERFTDHTLDGKLRSSHPRIILPDLAEWQGKGVPVLIARRIKLYKDSGIKDFDPCPANSGAMNLAACWISSGNNAIADKLVNFLKDLKLEPPEVSSVYGNGWEIAFAYDLLYNYANMSEVDHFVIENKIENALKKYLAVLDAPSPSLWHGRSSLASMAWICAVVLDPSKSHERLQLITRAQGHFLDVVRAAEITEGWPEGYNYWINSRAFYFTLAASAYLNGLVDAQNQSRIRNLLRRIGLWHIYATRPDNRIEGLGDEGSRVDLKDETRRIIDIIAQTTQDPVFSTYSRYLESLHGQESYYREYRWGFRLFNDPTVKSLFIGSKNLKAFSSILPKAELFGRDGLNLAYIHSDWGSDETFISFYAGNTFTHHGHYDAGHFSIFKGAPLAINSSTYGDYTGPNRLNYSIRTVAKNSLLVMRPGEKVKPNRFFDQNVADGGQRIIIPTGSWVQSTLDWSSNLNNGLHFAGGKIDNFDYSENDYVYLAADLTNAYNTPDHDEGGKGGKVSQVQRELVYLFDEDRLIIHDHVVSTKPNYTKKWLLHTANRPSISNAIPLIGSAENGILESHENVAIVKNGRGYLRIDRLYPDDGVFRLVGGPDYLFYVESDGDDSDLDGVNYIEGSNLRSSFDVGLWRIEIQPGEPRLEDDFLVVLSPSLEHPQTDQVERLSLTGVKAKGLITEHSIVVFISPTPYGQLHFTVPKDQDRLYLFGIPAGVQVKITTLISEQVMNSNTENVLVVKLRKGAGQVSLQW